MANTVTKTTLVNGSRNVVVLVNYVYADTAAPSDQVIIDWSDYDSGTGMVVDKIEGLCSGFVATLELDASTDLVLVRLPDGDWFCHNWSVFGGVPASKAGTGYTGDILLNASGMQAGDVATFIIHMRKS